MTGTDASPSAAGTETNAAGAAGTETNAAGAATTAPGGAPRRKYPVGAAVLLVVAAAGLWAASRMTWVTIVSSDGLTEPRTKELNGGLWFGALTPLALVLLAAVAAALATRGWLRRLVGVVVAVLAAIAAVPGYALLTGHTKTAARAATLAELPARAQVDQMTTASFPAVLTLICAVLAFAAGVLLARMPETTARLSGKYDNPVFRRAAAADQVAAARAEKATADDPAKPASGTAATAPDQLSERVLWDALDAGTDPTDDEPGR
ncbi:putative membrane protein (TIGR02234 family) [Nocardia transvalensis]|uniref:Putative membrane protein (TIGR02234 family) n=1 Tax=Nocardia transvalensis TaxID=37333 RepID=A0A7W9ULZ3_9NOCA|nr:putative membrane protein (TIGR02234 family) [Nocardia transvalensis]